VRGAPSLPANIRLQRLGRDRRSSLLQKFLTYGCKKFCNIDTRSHSRALMCLPKSNIYKRGGRARFEHNDSIKRTSLLHFDTKVWYSLCPSSNYSSYHKKVYFTLLLSNICLQNKVSLLLVNFPQGLHILWPIFHQIYSIHQMF
jgi:hypothetical protein